MMEVQLQEQINISIKKKTWICDLVNWCHKQDIKKAHAAIIWIFQCFLIIFYFVKICTFKNFCIRFLTRRNSDTTLSEDGEKKERRDFFFKTKKIHLRFFLIIVVVFSIFWSNPITVTLFCFLQLIQQYINYRSKLEVFL